MLEDACGEFEACYLRYSKGRPDLMVVGTDKILSAVRVATQKRDIKIAIQTFQKEITTVLQALEQGKGDCSMRWSSQVGKTLSHIYPFARFCVGLANAAGEVVVPSVSADTASQTFGPLKAVTNGIGIILQARLSLSKTDV
jgi:hypothetical protein